MVVLRFVIGILVLLGFSSAALAGSSDSADARSVFLTIALPDTVSRNDLIAADSASDLRSRLAALVHAGLAARPVADASLVDAIVVFLDEEGKPILPDLERRLAETNSSGEVLAPRVTDLSFTYNSPTYPWTQAELNALADAFIAFYPEAKSVYGDPAFSNVVNIRKDPTIGVAGYYDASSNEMVVQNTTSLDAVCHEMIHAFRDDMIVGFAPYEEGMTRAAEVEVFDRLPAYSHWDENHSYWYDMYFEGLDLLPMGSKYGWAVDVLLRYQLAGYAWAKPLLQNPTFLADFNRELYIRTASDPSTRSTETKLIAIGQQVQPFVEGRSYLDWYKRSGVLDLNPTPGNFIYQRINQFTVDYFFRDSSGYETPLSGAMLPWAVYDYAGGLLSSGVGTTTALGLFSFNPTVPAGYNGRIAVEVSDGARANRVERSWLSSGEIGVFGIVSGADTGTLTITPLDSGASPVTVSVTHGVFSIASMRTLRGRFLASYHGPAGMSDVRLFNKDASDYFLNLTPGVGSTPDGASVSGIPLTVNKAGSGDLTLSWGSPCRGSNSDYEVYEGALGDFTSHVAKTCSTGGATSASLTPGIGNHYYLVVARNLTWEGSYGRRKDGTERPPASSQCQAQQIEGCTAGSSGQGDLVIESLSHSPASPATTDTITFTAVVRNTGSATTGPAILDFRIGGETATGPNALYQLRSLAPGESVSIQRSATLPLGVYLNTAVADYFGDAPELNESNNQRQDGYSVH